MPQFNRGISSSFVDKLNAEFKRGGWWQALASDRELFIAIRDSYLNVYWNGCSLLKLTLDGERLVGKTHYKYLLNPDMPRPYIPIDGGVVKLPDAAALFLSDLADSGALKRAAAAYVCDEKVGMHQIVMSNNNVIDIEVAFGLEGNGNDSPSTLRIDFAAMNPIADGAEINFFEAKRFDNRELRASGNTASPVVGQIEGYQNLLAEHADALGRSYRIVCGNLLAIDGVRDRYASSLALMRSIADGGNNLHVNNDVRLVVFGFDQDQRDGRVWQEHRNRLQATFGERLLLIGNPQGFRRGISAPL